MYAPRRSGPNLYRFQKRQDRPTNDFISQACAPNFERVATIPRTWGDDVSRFAKQDRDIGPSTPQSADAQIDSRLIQLPQEIKDLIWKAYYSGSELRLDLERSYSSAGTVRRFPDNSLSLACKKIEEETRDIQPTTSWTMIVTNTAKKLPFGLPLFGCLRFQPKVETLLHNVHSLEIHDICPDNLGNRGYWEMSWIWAMTKMLTLRVLKVYYHDTIEVKHTFTSGCEAIRIDKQEYEDEFQRGRFDINFWSEVGDRTKLNWLAKEMSWRMLDDKWVGTRNLQIFLKSSLEYIEWDRIIGQRSVTFEVKADAFEAIQREGMLVESLCASVVGPANTLNDCPNENYAATIPGFW